MVINKLKSMTLWGGKFFKHVTEKSQINEETQSPYEHARAKADWNMRSYHTCDRSDGAQVVERQDTSKNLSPLQRSEKRKGQRGTTPEKLPGAIQISKEE